jgi:PIN domain nuclease of toxin-antitoxin system
VKLLIDTRLLLWAAGLPERLPGDARELLPPIHKDPFDRMLLAQSLVESITLVTSDRLMARYPVPVRQV